MCNSYEAADERYLHDTWREYERQNGAYKPHVGPRDMAPFVVPGRVLLAQWGMIRPAQPERVAKDSRGRPLMTNNAHLESVASTRTFRDAWKARAACYTVFQVDQTVYQSTVSPMDLSRPSSDTVP